MSRASPRASERRSMGEQPAATSVERVLLAEPRGFCAGVEMAIKALAWMVRSFPAARVLLPRDRPQPGDRRALRGPGRRVRRRHRRGAAGHRRSCSRPTGRRPRSSPPPRRAAATSSTRSARWSPRCTTRSGCGPARATASCTSATRATRRPSARWPSRRESITRVESVERRRGAPDVRRAGRPARPDDAVAPRLGRRRRRRARALPRRVVARPQRPVLRHDEPPVGADGAGRALRRHRHHRLGQLVEHASPSRSWPARPGCPIVVPGQRRRRAARRHPARRADRRRHRRRLGARRAGRRP